MFLSTAYVIRGHKLRNFATQAPLTCAVTGQFCVRALLQHHQSTTRPRHGKHNLRAGSTPESFNFQARKAFVLELIPTTSDTNVTWVSLRINIITTTRTITTCTTTNVLDSYNHVIHLLHQCQ